MANNNKKINYGLEVKKSFQIKDLKILINERKILIKININSHLYVFYIVFMYFLNIFLENLTNIYLVKIDSRMQIQKRKISYISKDLINKSINDFLSYDYFIEILNEVNETDFYDSDSSFQGEILGLEIRTKKEIILNENEEMLKINSLIKLKMNNLKE